MPSAEVTALSEELAAKIKAIQDGLDAVRGDKKLSTDARADKLGALNKKVDEAKKVYRSFKVELRELPKAESKELEPQSKEFNATLNKLGTEVMAAKVSGDRGDLVGGAASGDVGGDEQTEEQIRAKMDKTAAASLSSTDRSLAMLEKATKVGTETNQKLQEQTEQMKRIQNDSDKINTHAEKAKKVLGDMEKFFGGIFGRKKPDPKGPDEGGPSGGGGGAAGSSKSGVSPAAGAKGTVAKGGTTVSDETNNQLSDQARADVKKTDDNLDKMSDLLGGLNNLAVSMNTEVKAQSAQVDNLGTSIDKNNTEIQGLNDRTGKLLKKYSSDSKKKDDKMEIPGASSAQGMAAKAVLSGALK